ncbi:hypothetical protein Acr_07g0016680 [Actinidia rufa]|uniref:Uncharacterized protein n=1 Tax=Actinidia rufa TaxID=165716 RepID=A0A7J0EYG0_9ERIC|nr:hypothetical protein Acr_07g0016680 [Actinidia rufa]
MGVGNLVGPLRIGGILELWAPKFATVELRKQVTNANTSRDHGTCLALENTIMLPQDVADLAVEESEEFRDKMIIASRELWPTLNA